MAFLAALRFLTTIPLPGRQPTRDDLSQAPGYFPSAGLIIGLALAAVDALLRSALPQTVVAALLLVTLLALTGGLHLDGLADTCDGFFHGAATPAQRLEIMRDSRVGGYGVAGAITLILVQYAALGSLAPAVRPMALVLMATLSRWAMSFALAAFPYAHTEGMGTHFREGLRASTIVWGTVFTLVVCLVIAGALGAMLLTVVWCATWLAAKALMTRLPGLTGDTYGAISEFMQTLVLVLVLAAG